MLNIKFFVLAVTVLMYALVILFQQKKAYASICAAVLILIVESIFPDWAGAARLGVVEALTVSISWSVLLIYIGSLMIAELFIYSKMPARIADNIVCVSPNSGIAIVIILIITGIISAFVENVATVLVMAPIALALSKKTKISPVYFMIGLAVMSNLQGTATLVGDPPSMIFANFAEYKFNDFFFYNKKISIFFFVQIGMITGALFFYFLFAKKGKGKVLVEKEKIISVIPSVLFGLMIVGLASFSFILNKGVSIEAGLFVFLLGAAGLLWYKIAQKKSTQTVFKLVKGLDWETIFFITGIFVVIGALEKTGVLHDFALFLESVIGENIFLGFIIIILVSVIISGFVDNVPYIIAMLPVAKTLSEGLSLSPELFMFGLLIGSCLGGNLTPFGASANIVAVGLLKKEGISLRFSGWLKIGLPFTFVTTTAAALSLWFVWR
jgi:Na+/H+ antiporter NhaD/arsenite permease-like protein